ncbi:MAG TPA: DUF1275 family protein [Streptosporangiaceae bacterium]
MAGVFCCAPAAPQVARDRLVMTRRPTRTAWCTRVARVVAVGLPVDAGGAQRYVVIGLLAAGLGLQNATVRRLAVPNVTTTVLTRA